MLADAESVLEQRMGMQPIGSNKTVIAEVCRERKNVLFSWWWCWPRSFVAVDVPQRMKEDTTPGID